MKAKEPLVSEAEITSLIEDEYGDSGKPRRAADPIAALVAKRLAEREREVRREALADADHFQEGARQYAATVPQMIADATHVATAALRAEVERLVEALRAQPAHHASGCPAGIRAPLGVPCVGQGACTCHVRLRAEALARMEEP